MGVFAVRLRKKFRQICFLGILLVAYGSALAISAQPLAIDGSEGRQDPAVSTSPGVAEAPGTDAIAVDSMARQPAAAPAPDVRALTRAAARLRIDEMSPLSWLARFGDVAVGRRE